MKQPERERTSNGGTCTRARIQAVPGSGSQHWLVKGLVSRLHVRAPFLCQERCGTRWPCSLAPGWSGWRSTPRSCSALWLNASFCKKGGGQWSLQTLPTKESLPVPGCGQGSTEQSLQFEVVKDPMRCWQLPGHNIFFWVNTIFYDVPRRT